MFQVIRDIFFPYDPIIRRWQHSFLELRLISKGKITFFHRAHVFKKPLPFDREQFGPEILIDDPRFRGGFNDPERHPEDPPIATCRWYRKCRCGATAIVETRGPM